jgi:hypothetical protein
MNNAHSLWLIFILLGLATVLPRASFIVLGTRVALSSVVQRAFRYAMLLPHSPCGHCRTRVVVTGGAFDPFNAKLTGG